MSDLTLGPATSLAMLASCTSEGVASALKRGAVQLLEPCTSLEVTVPEDHVGRVLGDLTSSQRRAQIQEVGQAKQGAEKMVSAICPLAGLMVRNIYSVQWKRTNHLSLVERLFRGGLVVLREASFWGKWCPL